MDKDFVIVYAGDWQGVFVNGKLVYEDHKVSLSDMKEICKDYNVQLTDLVERYVTRGKYKRVRRLGIEELEDLM